MGTSKLSLTHSHVGSRRERPGDGKEEQNCVQKDGGLCLEKIK